MLKLILIVLCLLEPLASSASMSRAVSAMVSRWGGKLIPFGIIGLCVIGFTVTSRSSRRGTMNLNFEMDYRDLEAVLGQKDYLGTGISRHTFSLGDKYVLKIPYPGKASCNEREAEQFAKWGRQPDPILGIVRAWCKLLSNGCS